MSQERTQQLCYEILDCLKGLRAKPADVDSTEIWEALADRVIELEGHGRCVFHAELKSAEQILSLTQRRHRWNSDRWIAARISIYKDYCRLLSQAVEKYDKPTAIAHKAKHMADKHSDFNVGVAQSYELWKLRSQIRKDASND